MTRLSAERLDELYRGTLRLVLEHGFEKLTMDQVAEATRSSKATLYRQWGSKGGLVVAALRGTTMSDAPAPDTGSLRGDLREMMARRQRFVEREGDLVGAILHAVKVDPELGAGIREQLIATLHDRLVTVLGRAVERGEVAADNRALPHADLLMIAPFALRPVVEGADLDDDFVNDYVDAVLLPAFGVYPA